MSSSKFLANTLPPKTINDTISNNVIMYTTAILMAFALFFIIFDLDFSKNNSILLAGIYNIYAINIAKNIGFNVCKKLPIIVKILLSPIIILYANIKHTKRTNIFKNIVLCFLFVVLFISIILPFILKFYFYPYRTMVTSHYIIIYFCIF